MSDEAVLIVAPVAPRDPLRVVDEKLATLAVLEQQVVMLRDVPAEPMVVRDDAAPTVVQSDAPAAPGVVVAGFAGPRGPQGPQGEAGAAYTHTQATSSAVWTINHNLGFRPAIALLTDGGAVIDAEIAHASANTAVVTLSQPLAGTARCN
jgi:hypothetical protein